MRKFLLLTAMCLLAASQMLAGKIVYGMSNGDKINGVGVRQAGVNYSVAMEVPETVALEMQGSKVTEISLGFSAGAAKIAYLYLTYDLQGTPFYEQEVTVKVNRYNDFTLDTPYTIEGKKFYIGYRYRANTSTSNPIGFDGDAIGGNPMFSHIGMWLDNQEPEWTTVPQYGNLCLRATIEGDKLPTSAVMPAGIDVAGYAGVGESFDYKVRFRNMSANSISKVNVSTEIDGNVVDKEVTLPSAVAPGEFGEVSLSNSCSKENLEAKLYASFPAVDGNPNPFAAAVSSSSMLISNYVYPRIIVAEKLTGTGCGYCPRGIVGFEKMMEKYPDTFIGIAVQNYSTGDPMYCSAYTGVENQYLTSGAPCAVTSRNKSLGVNEATYERLNGQYLELAGMVPIRLRVFSEPIEGNKLLTTTTAEFGTAIENANYGVAIVITEDGLGPYSQNNNYAGGALGTLDGWESKGRTVSMIYDHVARTIVDPFGEGSGLPSSLNRGAPYVHRAEVTIDDEWVLDNINIISLLIDMNTGEILTAAKSKYNNPPLAVEGIGDDNADIMILPGNGKIIISGADAAEIYSIDGKLCARTRSNVISVTPGIYMVRATAGNQTLTRKLIVK